MRKEYERVLEIVNSFDRVVNDRFKISLEYSGYEKLDDKNYRSENNMGFDYCNLISTKINVEDMETGDKACLLVPMLKVPVNSVLGLKSGKSKKQVLSIYIKSPGWSVIPNKNEIYSEGQNYNEEDVNPYLEYNTTIGMGLRFVVKGNKMLVKSAGKGSSGVELQHFLRTLTKKSNNELLDLLGGSAFYKNMFKREESLESSIRHTANVFLDKELKKNSEIKKDISLINNILLNRIMPLDNLKLDENARDRYEQRSLFVSRAADTTLEEDIDIDGVSYKKGTLLSKDILEKIDSTSKTSLLVSTHQRIYKLMKHKSTGLGMNTNELLTMLNIYENTINGLGKVDDIYDPSTRILFDLKSNIERCLNKNINNFITNLENSLINLSQESFDLLYILGVTAVPDVDSLLRNLKDADNISFQSSKYLNLFELDALNNKITNDGGGHASAAASVVKEFEFGRMDSLEQPESQKVGQISHKTILSRTDKNGNQTAPYIVVKDGKSTGELVYLSANAESNKYIAQWNEKFDKDLVRCRMNKTIVTVEKKYVDYMEYSNIQTCGLRRANISFQECSNGKRLSMGCGFQKQAVVTLNLEHPKVSTGVFEALGDFGIITAEKALSEHYDDNKASISESKEEFIKKSLRIVGTEKIGSVRRVITEIVGTGELVSFDSDFMVANESKFMYTDYIEKSTKADRTYSGKDVIVRNMNVVSNLPEREKLVDFGHLEINDFSNDYALGFNAFVGFKTFESSTIDDAITVRQGFALDAKLTSVYLKELKINLHEDKDKKRYGISSLGSSKVEDYIEESGLPKIGTYLKAGSVYFVEVVSTGNVKYPRNKYLKNTESGYVVDTYINSNTLEAKVLIASTDVAEQGDKLSGRHGNKGVIGKVVPDHEMPYDKITGRPLDIILNPLGVPSRMNISQFNEIYLGLAAHRQDKDIIVSSFHPESIDFVRRKSKEMEVDSSIMIDGRTGLEFDRPINVGYLYMLKLKHLVKTKLASTNFCDKINPETGQPQSRTGAQSIGEMELDAYMANGCYNFVQEAFSTNSDNGVAKKELRERIKSNDDELESIISQNNNSFILQAFLSALHISLEHNGSSYTINPLTDSMISKMSPRGLNTSHPDNLYSEDTFGKAGKSASVDEENRKKYGYIDLGCEIINPFWIRGKGIRETLLIKSVKNGKFVYEFLLNMVKNVLNGKYVLTGFEEIETENGSVFIPEFTLDDQIEDIDDYEYYLSGITALVEVFKKNKISYYREFLNNLEKQEFYNSIDKEKLLNAITICESWENSGLDYKDVISTKLAIMPVAYRRSIKELRSTDPMETHYTNIYNRVREVKDSNGDYDNVSKLFDAFDSMCGLKTPGSGDVKSNIPSVLHKLKGDGDKGILRDVLVSKRVNFSGRTIITPTTNPKMKITEIGVPFIMATDIYEPFLIAELQKDSPLTSVFLFVENHFTDEILSEILKSVVTNNIYKFKSLLPEYSLIEYEIKELFFLVKEFMVDYLNRQVVVAGRQPTLHGRGIASFRLVVTFSKSIEIHPLACKAYNADFDGDSMYLIAAISQKSKDEVLTNLTLYKDIINPKDNSLWIEHVQDMSLGLYLATMLHENVTKLSDSDFYALENGTHKNIVFLNSIEELKCKLEEGMISTYNLAILNHKGKKYMSTVGRLEFNSLVPDGFTDKPFENTLKIKGINVEDYCALKYDCLLCKSNSKVDDLVTKSIVGVTREINENYPLDVIMDYLQYSMEFGFHHSDKSGISLGFNDVDVDFGLDEHKNKAREMEIKINSLYHKGFLTEPDRDKELVDLFSKLNDKCRNIINDGLSRNNNMFIISDSGARGNANQINQSIGMGGLTMETLNKSYPVAMLNSYTEGLTSMELNIASYGTRQSIYSTQVGTAEAGYGVRQLVNMLEGLIITENSCGDEEENYEKYNLVYSKPSTISIYNKKQNKTTTLPYSFTELLKFRNLTLINVSETVEENLRYVMKDNVLNDACLKLILKKKLRVLESKDFIITIAYKLDDLSKDYINLRVTNEAIGGGQKVVGLSSDEYIITDESIKLIEKEQRDYIVIRTVINCKTIEGICQKCYGRLVERNQLPAIGRNIGIEAAQSIGEPMAQLTMSLFHKGGAAGTSVSNGVSLANSLLKGSLPDKDTKCNHAYKSGHVKVKLLGNNAIITLDGLEYRTLSSLVDVVDGELVGPTDILSEGLPDYLDLGLDVKGILCKKGSKYLVDKRDINELLKVSFDGKEKDLRKDIGFKEKQKDCLLGIYFNTFKNNGISVSVRHFELVVKAQMSTVKVVNSNIPDIRPGFLYESNYLDSRLKELDGDNYYYLTGSKVAKQLEVVQLRTGIMTSLGFERMLEQLGTIAAKRQDISEKGHRGGTVIGEDITVSPECRTPVTIINSIVHEDLEVEEIIEENIDFNGADEYVNSIKLEDIKFDDEDDENDISFDDFGDFGDFGDSLDEDISPNDEEFISNDLVAITLEDDEKIDENLFEDYSVDTEITHEKHNSNMLGKIKLD